MDYYTAEQFIRIISQMGYILGGLAIDDSNYDYLPSHLADIYLRKILDGEVYFIRFNISFHRKLKLLPIKRVQLNIGRVLISPFKVIAYFKFKTISVGAHADIVAMFSR